MSKLEHDQIVRQNLGISSERNLKQSWKFMVGQFPPIAIGINKSQSMSQLVGLKRLTQAWFGQVNIVYEHDLELWAQGGTKVGPNTISGMKASL